MSAIWLGLSGVYSRAQEQLGATRPQAVAVAAAVAQWRLVPVVALAFGLELLYPDNALLGVAIAGTTTALAVAFLVAYVFGFRGNMHASQPRGRRAAERVRPFSAQSYGLRWAFPFLPWRGDRTA